MAASKTWKTISSHLRVRKYRFYKVVCALIIFELPVIVATLALFSIANPNLYRSRLWQDGADNGFNSAPSEILYSYANYHPISTPLPWSQFTTTWNVVIAVLATFIMIIKWVLLVTRTLLPIISLVIHGLLSALFAVAIHNQAAPDMSDPDHPQPGAPCIVYFSMLVVCLISMIFPKTEPESPSQEKAMATQEQQQWEMRSVPPTPGTTGAMKSPMPPVTPRTMAFNALGGSPVPQFDPPPKVARKGGR
ncbi:MAG: hypothetical protein M1834_008026 [Cirrosporium novae-zelandiae]|nr:MAG: hypothetical protein M1834_008026 [Cirrosporium novae-zelandiae]